MIAVMKIFAATPVALLALYLTDALFFEGHYTVLILSMLRPVGQAVGISF
jgi:hypothetical protein